MLTPTFVVTQTPSHVTIDIRAPYARVADTEVFVDGKDFRFFSKPYFLRLRLPRPLADEEREKIEAKYDFDEGHFVVVVAKETEGEHFEGLELISNLLSTKKKTKDAIPFIQVLDENEEDDDVDDDDDEWLWDQRLQSEDDDPLPLAAPTYGFAGKASGLFATKLSEERHEILDLSKPDSTWLGERRRLRRLREDTDFSADHYLADLFDCEEAEALTTTSSKWGRRYKKDDDVPFSKFSEDDKILLKNLRRREFLLDAAQKRTALLSILDVLLAACYDVRTTADDPTSESGWTVNKISAALSWFIEFSSVEEVLFSFVRRSLIYPLYRRWDLSVQCVRDVVDLLRRGRVALVQLLVEVYRNFLSADPRWILNDLFVVDMIYFAQRVKAERVNQLADEVERRLLSLHKAAVQLELVELEAAAELARREGEAGDLEDDDDDDNTSSSSDFDSDDDSHFSKEVDENCRKVGEKTEDVDWKKEEVNVRTEEDERTNKECGSKPNDGSVDSLVQNFKKIVVD